MHTEERGTLYQCLQIMGMADIRAHYLFIRWVDACDMTFTFRDLVAAVGFPDYELKLDERVPAESRVAKPGYLVFGRKPGDPNEDPSMVGVFVPEGRDKEVERQLRKDFHPRLVIFTSLTLRELSVVIPCARGLPFVQA